MSTLRVVGFTRWLAEDMQLAAPELSVIADDGLDAPAGGGDYWWCSLAHMSRLRATGISADVTTPGPRWLPDLPHWLTRREIAVFTVGESVDGCSGWYKIAEAKVDALPAKWWDSGAEFAAAASAAHVPQDSIVQYTPTTLEGIECEYRAFCTPDDVAVTPYLSHGVTWDALTTDEEECDRARSYVLAVLDEVRHPPNFVLDVAVLDSGEWCVMEANPAWSSNPYALSRSPVAVAAIIGAQVPSVWWEWEPDAYYRWPVIARPLPRRSAA